MKSLESSRQDALVAKHRSRVPLASPVPATGSSFFENRITLSITEFAARTGLSPKSVERMIKRDELVSKKVGRRVLIPTSAIETWLSKKE